MKRFSVKTSSMVVKLPVMIFFSVAVLFLILTLVLSQNAAPQGRNVTLTN